MDTYRWIQSGLKADTRRSIAIAIARLARRKPTRPIPYSTDYDDGVYFEPGTLRYLRNAPGEGLTCATFVLAVFEAFGIRLLDLSTWPSNRPVDKAWRANILGTLRSRPEGDPNIERHIAAIESNDIVVRYRPEEVASGVGSSTPPLTFEVASVSGRKIKALLAA